MLPEPQYLGYDGPFTHYWPSCCAIGLLVDWPEWDVKFPQAYVKECLRDLKLEGYKRVFITFNSDQNKIFRKSILKLGFKEIDNFMGNEGKRIYIFMKKFR